MNRFILRMLGAMMALTVLSAIAGAQVQDTSGTASVNVQPALSITLVTSPDWGRVTRPPSGSAQYTLNYNTGAVTNNSGDGYAFDDGAAGEYTVNGAPSGPISFSAAIGAFSDSGLTVIATHINGSSASGTGTLDGSGAFTLKIGGIVSVASDATLTTQTATVTITVDYQ